MIELTPEQRQAVDLGEPVRVVDPATHNAYVVVRAEIYESLAGPLPPPSEETAPSIAPAMLRSQQAYWRDLPELLRDRRNRGKYVAYHGQDRIGLGKRGTELYRRCLQRGFQRGEFYVAPIEARETPPWVPTPLEQSLYEFTDEGPPNADSPRHDDNP